MISSFLASSSFFIIIALGYWLRPSFVIFKSLGFLMPFSILLNFLLKWLFHISYPDIYLDTVHIHGLFSFPDCDVQLATVFWLLVSLSLSINLHKYLCMAPIIIIAIVKIISGSSTLYDVIGGFLFGFGFLYLWQRFLKHVFFSAISSHRYEKYWGLVSMTILLYALTSQGDKWLPAVTMSIGALVGFGVVLGSLMDQNARDDALPMRIVIISLLVLVGILLFPVTSVNTSLLHFIIFIKYLIVSVGLFTFIPDIIAEYILAKFNKYFKK
jgi:hypothetical protein